MARNGTTNVTLTADTSRWDRLMREETDRADRRRVRNADMRDLATEHAQEFQDALDKVTQLVNAPLGDAR